MKAQKVYVGYVIYNLDCGGDYTLVAVSNNKELVKKEVADVFDDNKEFPEDMISPDEVSDMCQTDEEGIMAYGYEEVPYLEVE